MNEKFDVILESAGSLRIAVVRAVYRAIVKDDAAAALVAANEMVGSAPVAIKTGLSKIESDKLSAELEGLGAKVSVRPSGG